MKFVKKEKEETRYFIPEVAQAIGLSAGTIQAYFTNKGISTKDGITLDDIVEVIERKRKRGDGINFGVVAEIRRRLVAEKGYVLDRSDEETSDVE